MISFVDLFKFFPSSFSWFLSPLSAKIPFSLLLFKVVIYYSNHGSATSSSFRLAGSLCFRLNVANDIEMRAVWWKKRGLAGWQLKKCEWRIFYEALFYCDWIAKFKFYFIFATVLSSFFLCEFLEFLSVSTALTSTAPQLLCFLPPLLLSSSASYLLCSSPPLLLFFSSSSEFSAHLLTFSSSMPHELLSSTHLLISSTSHLIQTSSYPQFIHYQKLIKTFKTMPNTAPLQL